MEFVVIQPRQSAQKLTEISILVISWLWLWFMENGLQKTSVGAKIYELSQILGDYDKYGLGGVDGVCGDRSATR